MKLISLILGITLSLVLLASVGSLVQAEEDNAEVKLRVKIIYPPSVATIIASPVGSDWTVLRGTLTHMGTASSVDVSFEWGETTDYGSMTAVQTMTRPGAFWATITGLTLNTTYHFRSVAVGDATSYGLDRSFTTRSPPPLGPPSLPPGTTDVRGEVSTAGIFTAPVTATSDDGLFILDIPKGTVGLTEDLEPLIEISMVTIDEPPPPPEAAHVVGLTYDFGPDGTTFEPAITLTWSYDPADIPKSVAEEDLVIAYYDEALLRMSEIQARLWQSKVAMTGLVLLSTGFLLQLTSSYLSIIYS